MRAARAEAEVRVPHRAPTRDTEVVPTPADAPGSAPRRGWAPVLRVWLPVVLLLVLLDVTFPLWFWHIPKLTSRDADYGYQFLADAHRLATAPAAEETIAVLAIGSSIAGSFDPSQVATLLANALPEQTVAVDRLLVPGIKPSDLRLFFASEGAGLRPDVAFILLNPLDFLNPSFERGLKPQVRYVLPPWTTLRERSAFIGTISDKLDLALAGVSNLYRYRKLIRSSLEDHARFLWRAVRHRTADGAYGIDPDGYAKQSFGVPIAGGAVDLEYYIAPEWIAQRGIVTLRFRTAAGLLAERRETRPGWKRLQVPLPADAGRVLHVSADSAWSPRATGVSDDLRLLGVRLRAVPAPVASNGAAAPLEYPPAEQRRGDRLLRMGGAEGAEFVARWREVLEADTEFGRRFRAYRDNKLAIRDEPIEPTGEYAEFERLVAMLADRGTRVVIINAPESSLLRDHYETGPFYRSYLDFLAGVAARTPGAEFHDFRALLGPSEFNDWHHPNYVGRIKLGPAYAELARQVVTKNGSAATGG